MTQHFWKKWQTEYLSRLQQRSKWRKGNDNVKVGDVVLVKDENFPPTRWPLARITQVHPGEDGVVRVVSLRSKGNTISKRPVVKLCPLPIEEENNNVNKLADSMIKSNLTHTKNVETANQKQRTKRKETKLGYILMHLLVILNCVTQGHAEYVIKRPQPGLYVEQAGQVKISRGTLKVEIVSTLNISDEYRKVDEIVHKMEMSCRISASYRVF